MRTGLLALTLVAGCNAVFGLDGVHLADGGGGDDAAAPDGGGGGDATDLDAAGSDDDASASCGDGITETGEECDDANHTAGDGCSPTCHVELTVIGCSDGAREDFADLVAWPNLAACGGAWAVAGMDTPAVTATSCARVGDDSLDNAAGNGCAAANLCAPGWHLCQSASEVAVRNSGASCLDLTGFFATRQAATLLGACTVGAPGVAGCGASGEVTSDCAPLDTHAGTDCTALAGDGFTCNSGTPRASLTHTDPTSGGVLCCR